MVFSLDQPKKEARQGVGKVVMAIKARQVERGRVSDVRP